MKQPSEKRLCLIDVIQECLKNSELVKEFNRLRGCSVGIDKRTPIEIQIDNVTGYNQKENDMYEFIGFVIDCVWLPLLNMEKENFDGC